MAEPALRRAHEVDRDFIFESYKATLREHVEWAWGWDENFQRSNFWKNHPISEFQVIELAGVRAGGMHVEIGDMRNFVRLIFLLPEFQGRGLGSALLCWEADRAKRAGKCLELKVVKSNPAKSLYDRLGFQLLEQDDATYHMRLV